MRTRIIGSAALLTATLIWGTSLVAQSLGNAYVGPFTFNAARFFIGAFILLPVILAAHCRGGRRRADNPASPPQRNLLLWGGVLCGCIVFVTASLQQVGIAYTTVGKAGFITALYIILVPVLGLFRGKRVGGRIWACIALAVVGMYLLCIQGTFSLGLGDSLVLLCACSTAVHILAIDYFSCRVNCVNLSCIQFLTCGTLSLVVSLVFERPSAAALISAAAPILYTGIFSCGIAYTLQAVGQKHVSSVSAALILSLESVFSALSGWVLLGETLSIRELLGCTVIFAAILAAQIPMKRKD